MQKHNILGKKAEASAAFKEKLIALTAWTFILFCICLVFYFSKIGLKSLFLTSNKHFTLENIDISIEDLPENATGLVDIDKLKKHLALNKGTDNLFEIDLKKVHQKTLDNICVKSANVSFLFPDTIKISLNEKRPIARLDDNLLVTTAKEKNSAFILPSGWNNISLPIIRTQKYSPGETVSKEGLMIPLKTILFNETFRMKYDNAEELLGRKDFASMEIINIQSLFIDKHNTLHITLNGSNKLQLANHARLKILADDIELGIRRACIAIIENALARTGKPTAKIDARYSRTPTE